MNNMVQDQLVDYISSQMKLGVSRDAIRSALVSAGWVAADVDDTLKKVEGGAKAQPVVAATTTSVSNSKPVGMSTGIGASASSMGVAAKSGEPQMIRVSDLVSSSPAMTASTVTGIAAGATVKSNLNKDPSFGGKISGNTFQATPDKKEKNNSSMLIGGIVAVVLVLGLGGLAWYFYSGNAALASQVKSLTGQAASVNAQLSSLQSQVEASGTALNSQIAILTSANTALALNLSFYAAPPGSSPTSTFSLTISGMLSGGGKAPYALTTSYGAKIFVANSSDAVIGPELKSFVGDMVQLAGTYMPGSDQLTVTSVATSTGSTQ